MPGRNREELERMKKDELLRLARDRGITGTSEMTKEELIEKLGGGRGEQGGKRRVA